MRNFLFLSLIIGAWAVPTPYESSDDECSMEWSTVYADPTSTSPPSIASTTVPNLNQDTAAMKAPNNMSTAQTNSSSAISSDGSHVSAPVADIAVPNGASIYTPPTQTFSGNAFGEWAGQQAKSSPAAKWLKIAPGTYNLDLGDILVISFMAGLSEGWTIDLRGVTFLCKKSGDSNQAIYINQCNDLTIYGGTIWFDFGEIWTQARVTDVTAIDGTYSTATLTVDEGYDLATWRGANARNLNTIDTSNPDHFTRPNINYWFVDPGNFDNLDSKRTFTFRFQPFAAPLKVGYTLTLATGNAVGNTIASEFNSNLHVNGLTSNGGFGQYGPNGQTPATLENVYYVNPPARSGYAPRVQGPTLSFGHIGGFDFDAEGNGPIKYVNSRWQYTGSAHDLADMANQTVPSN